VMHLFEQETEAPLGMIEQLEASFGRWAPRHGQDGSLLA
jgi:hypothetical protein